MSSQLLQEIIATYKRHGWKLQRVLWRPQTRAVLQPEADEVFEDAVCVESDLDALWFARPSTASREAWELRLVAEQPYALFEAFEKDELEADRERKRGEMEIKLREYASARPTYRV